MPPSRKKVKVEEEQKIKAEEEQSSVTSVGSQDWEIASSDSAYSRYAVLRARPDVDRMFDQVGRFEQLPAATLVATIIGVCARLQNALTHWNDVPEAGTAPIGSRLERTRYFRLLTDITTRLTDAVTDLMAAEVVFIERARSRDS